MTELDETQPDVSDFDRRVTCTNADCPENGVEIELPAGWDLATVTCGGSDFSQSPMWFCQGPLTETEVQPR